MQSLTLLALLAAGVAPVLADETTLQFAYWSGSSDSIGGLTTDGQSVSFASGDSEVYHGSYPDNATPCSTPGTKYSVTATCFEGTAEFTCYSSFSGAPESCNGKAPDGSTADGTTSSDATFAGITMGVDGNCVGSINVANTCTSDDTFTLSATIL